MAQSLSQHNLNTLPVSNFLLGEILSRSNELASFYWKSGERQIRINEAFASLTELEKDASLYQLIRQIGLSGWQKLRKSLQEAPNLQLTHSALVFTKEQRAIRLHLMAIRCAEADDFIVVGIGFPSDEHNTIQLLSEALPSIFKKAPLVLNLIDKNGVVKLLTGAGLKKINFEENETVGQSIYSQYPTIAPYVSRAQAGEFIRFKEEIRRNGNSIYFLSYFFPIPSLDLVAGISVDITEQELNQETAYHHIQTVNKELEERNQLLDTVVYATAHDLKTPIANLEVLMDLYESAKDPKERKQFWQALRQSAQRLKNTSQGLMEVIAFENTASSNKRLKFSTLIQDILDEFRMQLEKLRASVNLSLEVKHIQYNKAYLESILRNLISNSIKYSQPDQPLELSIKTQEAEDGVLLEVEDNGIGIDLKSHKDRLFKPFKRFTQQASGSGVGLYLMKRIIERNGGSIQILSSENKGCKIQCTLVPTN